MKLKYKKVHPDGKIFLPQKPGDAGYDVIAVEDPIFENGYIQYNTGIALEIPKGYHVEIFPRSSISKYDIVMANSVGVVDNSYRGTVFIRFKVALSVNPTGLEDHLISATLGPSSLADYINIPIIGDRIAQLILRKTEHMELEEVEILSETVRGTGGFGSTGLK